MLEATAVRFIQLANQLLTLSKNRRIEWTESEGAFWTRVGGWVVEIRSQDGDGHHPFRLVIETAEGVIDGLSTDVDPFPDEGSRFGSWRDRFAELYRVARLQGSITEKALDEIFDNLPDPDIPF